MRQTPFVSGMRVMVREAGGSELAVGTLVDLRRTSWVIDLADRVPEGSFAERSTLVLSTPVGSGLISARTTLVRRSDGVLVVEPPRAHDQRDRRRDVRVPASGMTVWATGNANGVARVADVSRAGLKMEAGRTLQVGDRVALDVPEGARVSAMVVFLSEDIEVRWAHMAFLRASEDECERIVEALTREVDDPFAPLPVAATA